MATRAAVFTERDWVFLTGRPREKVLSLHLWLRFAVLWVAVVVIGFVEGYILLPFGLAAFLGAIFLFRLCDLACCAEVALTTRRLTSALTLLSFRAKTEKTNAGRAFFLFIASCITLWLIQLATESIERRRDSHRIQRGTARERYRGHLILVKAHQEADTADWCNRSHPIQPRQPDLSRRSPGPTS